MKLKIKVKPNSGEQSVERTSDDEFFVKLKSTPESNKANVELIKVLSKYFGKDVRIKSGFNSKRKLVEVGD